MIRGTSPYRAAPLAALPALSPKSPPPAMDGFRSAYADEPLAAPFPTQQNSARDRSVSAGKAFALGVAATLAVLGGAALVSDLSPPPEPSLSVPLTHGQRRALEQLDLIHTEAQQFGGSLKVDGYFLKKQATPSQAFEALSQGDPVHFYPTGDAQAPVTIHNPFELEQVARRVREVRIERSIREGIEEIREGMRELGRELRDILGGGQNTPPYH
ncbi:MAG: hypothetical protein HY319_18600 [Armatimonadetes bacterium]|nr:hypothetical protein [Armatimonadota bacterium]